MSQGKGGTLSVDLLRLWTVFDLFDKELGIMVPGHHILAGRHQKRAKLHAPPNADAQLACRMSGHTGLQQIDAFLRASVWSCNALACRIDHKNRA